MHRTGRRSSIVEETSPGLFAGLPMRKRWLAQLALAGITFPSVESSALNVGREGRWSHERTVDVVGSPEDAPLSRKRRLADGRQHAATALDARALRQPRGALRRPRRCVRGRQSVLVSRRGTTRTAL